METQFQKMMKSELPRDPETSFPFSTCIYGRKLGIKIPVKPRRENSDPSPTRSRQGRDVLLLHWRSRAAGEAGAEVRCRQVHRVRLDDRPRRIREGSESLLRPRVAVARQGSASPLQKLQPLLPPSAVGQLAAQGSGGSVGAARRTEVSVLQESGGARLSVLPLLRFYSELITKFGLYFFWDFSCRYLANFIFVTWNVYINDS